MAQTINKYAHLEYGVLHELQISINEYWFLDMVYQLSRDGWCYKSLENIAIDMRLTKNGVVKLRDRLIERGFIIKDRKGRLKTGVSYNSVYRLDEKSYNLVTNRTTKYNAGVQLSGTKNNNRITIEYGNEKKEEDNRGAYSPAKEKIRLMLKQKGIVKSL